MQATAQATKTWTILALIEWGTEYLQVRGFEDARLNIELLLSHTLQYKRIDLYSKFDRPLSGPELAEFKAVLQRRLTHEPLQYITGETEFMGIPLYVNPSVLIPRPETEELVEKALEWMKTRSVDRIDVLDVGTGSGNISIALERFSPAANVISIDVSTEALAVAASNMERHGCSRILLQQCNVFCDLLPGTTFDMVIANPPYISAGEFALLAPEVKEFEPVIATTDNGDGLKFIRRVCELAVARLRSEGSLFMEIAHNQGVDATGIAVNAGLADVKVFRDLSGNERMLSARQAR